MKPEDEEQISVQTEEPTTSSSVFGAANGRLRKQSGFIGRHRLQAAISHLDNQIHIIHDELKQLDSIDRPSAVCTELIPTVESAPDPLLPMTRGPMDISWERWFGGATSSRSHRRWL